MDENSLTFVGMAKAGDAEAFGELYAMVWKDLYRAALYALGSREDAEDAVQETALEAYRSIGSLRDESAFRYWIFTILMRSCRRRFKALAASRRSVALDELDETGLVASAGNPDQRLELRRALLGIRPEERLVVILSFIGGYTSGELAHILKRPGSTVRSQLHRGLGKLRNILGEE